MLLTMGVKSTLEFQLTHPWGCDYFGTSPQEFSPEISTHTPVRVWLLSQLELIFPKIISTHTPVRVWLRGIAIRLLREIFQLTHPWGCDGGGGRGGHWPAQFQLTHPWGCDPICVRYSQRRKKHFNSHTREGVTLRSCYDTYEKVISTHTPVRVWPLRQSK